MIAQPVGDRWRLRFAKTGPASLLGHLDLIRELPRIFRRAGIRVAYTKGFHPKPDLAFAPALSLGVASLDEYVDATLIDAPVAALVIEQLEQATSSGLHFLDATRLPERAPSLSKCISAARYAIVVPTGLVDALGGPQSLVVRMDEFLASSEAVIVRNIDRQQKRIDVRRYVTQLRLGRESLAEATRAAGMSGEFHTLEVVISITPTGSAKALEVARALFGESSRDCRAVRVALLDMQGAELHRRFRGAEFDVSGLSGKVQPEMVSAEA